MLTSDSEEQNATKISLPHAKTLYNPWLPGIILIIIGLILGLQCLTSLSTKFPLHRGGQFYWWNVFCLSIWNGVT